ncbi:hypothetical protein, partial [Nocardioides sp.]|uniref:hypothetical protein n=1 Tax=Nocardioides sp. TaxID=35761 RepID=UPI0031FF20FE
GDVVGGGQAAHSQLGSIDGVDLVGICVAALFLGLAAGGKGQAGNNNKSHEAPSHPCPPSLCSSTPVLVDLVARAPADNTRARCAARLPPVFLSGRGGYRLQ